MSRQNAAFKMEAKVTQAQYGTMSHAAVGASPGKNQRRSPDGSPQEDNFYQRCADGV